MIKGKKRCIVIIELHYILLMTLNLIISMYLYNYDIPMFLYYLVHDYNSDHSKHTTRLIIPHICTILQWTSLLTISHNANN